VNQAARNIRQAVKRAWNCKSSLQVPGRVKFVKKLRVYGFGCPEIYGANHGWPNRDFLTYYLPTIRPDIYTVIFF
jgi:hypothetical protein